MFSDRLLADHVHMLISIPPKYAVSQVIGFIKGKSAIHLARVYGEQTQSPRLCRGILTRSYSLATLLSYSLVGSGKNGPFDCRIYRAPQLVIDQTWSSRRCCRYIRAAQARPAAMFSVDEERMALLCAVRPGKSNNQTKVDEKESA